jgi:CRISPR-associated protein Csb1
MPLDLSALNSASRLLVEADLRVATGGGGRFQPTGFPDLGPALYRGADGANWLLVESPQSMANRLERVCWVDGNDEADRAGSYNLDCQGIPYVLSTDSDGGPLTASTLEAHRLSSPYIWDTQPSLDLDNGQAQVALPDYLKRVFGLAENRLIPWKKVAEGLLSVDPGCLLHGIWFNEASFAGGKVRLTRVLSGYIEARDPSAANFGFQKRDSVSDRTDKEAGQSAAEGYGSVIGPKQHFTSPEIKAYFQVDLERLRSYGLSTDLVHALAAWAIYKIRRVLVASRDGIADLRTECKFAAAKVSASLIDSRTGNTSAYTLPELNDDLIAAFARLKRSGVPIRLRWVPNIEGKSELPDGVLESAVVRTGFEARTKFETPKPKKGKGQSGQKAKRLFVVCGEWTADDKEQLRTLNPEDPAKAIVQKAIRDYEAKWEAKAQSRKTDETDDQDDGEVVHEFDDRHPVLDRTCTPASMV